MNLLDIEPFKQNQQFALGLYLSKAFSAMGERKSIKQQTLKHRNYRRVSSSLDYLEWPYSDGAEGM